MRLTVISCVFPPEPIVSAQTSAHLAEAFACKGHEVSVITNFPTRPQGSLYPGYRRRLHTQQKANTPYMIVRCFSTFSRQSSIISRFLENFSFGISSGLVLLFSRSPDVIYANTWPIFAQGLAVLIARIKNIPLILSVQDTYPESLVSQGRIKKDGIIYRSLLAIDRWITRQCCSVVVISDQLASSYGAPRSISQEKIKIVPNWIDSGAVDISAGTMFRRQHEISEDAFVVVYGGNIGVAAGVENFLQAIAGAAPGRETVFVIAGSGVQLKACQELSRKLINVRVVIHSPWSEEETSSVLRAANVLLLPTRGDQSLVSVPSKMITYMLSARPILAVVHPASDTAQIIHAAQCGWVISPGAGDDLARKVEELSRLPSSMLEKLGNSGREYALNHFVTEACLPKLSQIILEAAQ